MEPSPLTVSQLFCRALSLTPPASLRPPTLTQGGAYCTLRHCGRPVLEGYAVTDVITSATNELVDTFRGNPSGLVCPDCASLFTQDHNLGAWLIFEDGAAYNPLISRQSAADRLTPSEPETDTPEVKRPPKIDRSAVARPCWSDLVRDIWPVRQGQNLVCLLTTNTKKRQWPRCQSGPLGGCTPVYLHDGPDDAVIRLDWPRLLTCLSLIEEAYTLGFSKESIRTNLLMQTKAAQEVGLGRTAQLERAVNVWRMAEEFTPALLIAQKPLNAEGKFGSPLEVK